MTDDGKLAELLLLWEAAQREGRSLSAEELCRDHPELLTDVSTRLRAEPTLSSVHFPKDTNYARPVRKSPSAATSATRSLAIDETTVGAGLRTAEQLVAAMCDLGLCDADEETSLLDRFQGMHAVTAAKDLIAAGRLTEFQSQELLRGGKALLALDRYIILDKLGAGGMGTVYRALHRQMDRLVALKILPPSAVDSPEKVHRFRREVRVAAKLHHPNIVVAHDASQWEGIHFLVMEYVPGSDLSRIVAQKKSLTVRDAIDYISQAARGLAYAHRQGIIHRDIKPANLLLDQHGTVKILDLGLARMHREDESAADEDAQSLTQAGAVLGTVTYLPPEQSTDTRLADSRSDIYSLGCTLYFLLVGRPPYVESTAMKTLLAHHEAEVPSLLAARPDVPPQLDAIFRKMVAKKPAHRYQSMDEVELALASLQAALLHQPEVSNPPKIGTEHHRTRSADPKSHPDPTKPSSWSVRPTNVRRHWIRNTLVAIGVVGLLALLAGVLLRIATPAGTILVEIEQPELIGAVLSIDEQQQLTISSTTDPIPIQVRADSKRHTLRVTKGGFETFTQQFSVRAGSEQTIHVRLEPTNATADAAGDSATRAPPPAEASGTSRGGTPAFSFALAFDGVDDYVEFPTLNCDAGKPFTFEAWCHVAADKPSETDHMDPLFTTNGFHQPASNLVLILARDAHGWWMARQAQRGGEAITTHLYHNQQLVGRRHHVAAVWEGGEMRLFYDGQPVARGGSEMAPIAYESEYPDKAPVLGRTLLLHSRVYRYFRGTVDEIRLSASARYSASFTPEDRFPRDEQTMALFHFDEGHEPGDVLFDVSGNGCHGKVHGATWVKVAASSADRAVIEDEERVARWVLENGGWISDVTTKVSSLDDLRLPVTLLSIILHKSSTIRDADLEILRNLPYLAVLSLSETQITDDGMIHVARLPVLTRLDVQHSRITGEGLRLLATHPSLQTIWADGLPVTIEDVSFLATIPNLEELSLSDASLTDAVVPSLKRMSNLRRLNLRGTSITSTGLAELQQALPGCAVKH